MGWGGDGVARRRRGVQARVCVESAVWMMRDVRGGQAMATVGGPQRCLDALTLTPNPPLPLPFNPSINTHPCLSPLPLTLTSAFRTARPSRQPLRPPDLQRLRSLRARV